MRRYVLLITSLASFLTPFMGSAVNIALPAIGTRFSAGAIGLGWVATAYTLAAAVFLGPFGRVADLRGRELVFTIGIGIDAVASLGCAFAPASLPTLGGLGTAGNRKYFCVTAVLIIFLHYRATTALLRPARCRRRSIAASSVHAMAGIGFID